MKNQIVNIVGYLRTACGCPGCGCGGGFHVAEMPAANAVRVVSVLNDIIAPIMCKKYDMMSEEVALQHLGEVVTSLEREAGISHAEAENIANEVICHLWGSEFSIEDPECGQCGQNLPATQWGCTGCDLDAAHQ